MTKQEWLDLAKQNQQQLESLIGNYHPVCLQPNYIKITAPRAEKACEIVRDNIRKNFEGNPVIQFLNALQEEDVRKISNLLNDAWFGVPESTSCWQIEGFREAVALLEDPPE